MESRADTPFDTRLPLRQSGDGAAPAVAGRRDRMRALATAIRGGDAAVTAAAAADAAWGSGGDALAPDAARAAAEGGGGMSDA